MAEEALACPVCGSRNVLDMPVPTPLWAMVSDGGLVGKPLRKKACCGCGYGFHAVPLTVADLQDIYGSRYSIGLYDPQADMDRARDYGRQVNDLIGRALGSRPKISSFVEFGSSSGSLLSILAQEWQSDVVTGVEPSARLVAFARTNVAETFSIVQSFAEDFVAADTEYDVCLSVNVIEHALSPTGFLSACRKVLRRDGLVVVVCPDGETASSELLFYDHISSFTVMSMSLCAKGAGLTLIASAALQGRLSGFRAYLLRAEGRSMSIPVVDFSDLAAERSRFMEDWRQLEGAVLRAVAGQDYVIFGTGEFTDLLNAYSPSVIDRARCFIVDAPICSSRGTKSVISTHEFLSGGRSVVLGAVNLRNWGKVRQRFEAAGIRIFHPLELAQRSRLP